MQRGDAALQAQLYAEPAHRATLQRLLDHAALALQCGYPVILDATFLAADARQQARELATRLGAQFVILHFEARPETLRQRVRRRTARGDDASDADLAVLEAQLRQAHGLDPAEAGAVIVVDAEAELDDAAAPARWLPLAPQLAAHGVSLDVGPAGKIPD